MINLQSNEYYRCFNKFKLKNADKFSYALFDMYEMYPMLYSITPIKIKVKQRIKSFHNDCLEELDRQNKINIDDVYKEMKIEVDELKDSYLLSCFYKEKIYKHIKLLKNNKVDFTYDKAIYAIEEKNYIENLFERHMESVNVLSNWNFDVAM